MFRSLVIQRSYENILYFSVDGKPLIKELDFFFLILVLQNRYVRWFYSSLDALSQVILPLKLDALSLDQNSEINDFDITLSPGLNYRAVIGD